MGGYHLRYDHFNLLVQTTNICFVFIAVHFVCFDEWFDLFFLVIINPFAPLSENLNVLRAVYSTPYRILLRIFTQCASMKHFIPHFIFSFLSHSAKSITIMKIKNKTRQININSRITLLLWFDNCVYRREVQ